MAADNIGSILGSDIVEIDVLLKLFSYCTVYCVDNFHLKLSDCTHFIASLKHTQVFSKLRATSLFSKVKFAQSLASASIC